MAFGRSTYGNIILDSVGWVGGANSYIVNDGVGGAWSVRTEI